MHTLSRFVPRFVAAIKHIEIFANTVVLHSKNGCSQPIHVTSEAVAKAIGGMNGSGLSEEELCETLCSLSESKLELCEFMRFIEMLIQAQLIEYVWILGSDPIAVIEPLSSGFELHHRPSNTYKITARLSGLSYLHQIGDLFVLESPDASSRVVFLNKRALTWLTAVQKVGMPPDEYDFWSVLSLLCFSREDETQESATYQTWQFHDRLFHSMTRHGIGRKPQGATYRFLGKFPPPTHSTQTNSITEIDLPSNEKFPDYPLLIPIREVFARRSSSRKADDALPITFTKLAAVLEGCARTTQVLRAEPQDLYFGPVPSAGALQELEVYVVVRTCEGLTPGFYKYVRVKNSLARLVVNDQHIKTILGSAARSLDGSEPQCLIVIATRLPILAWKYEDIAYRLTLINLGILCQAIYTVATALDLSCCAIGTGESGAFAAATGIAMLEETSIGEIAIGSRLSRNREQSRA